MTDNLKTSLIISTGPIVTGLCAVWASLINRKKIEEVHKLLNSRLDAMLEAVQSVAHAKGMSDQRDLDKSK